MAVETKPKVEPKPPEVVKPAVSKSKEVPIAPRGKQGPEQEKLDTAVNKLDPGAPHGPRIPPGHPLYKDPKSDK